MPPQGAPKNIILASNNRHKIQEIQAMLGASWKVLGAGDVVPNLTWEENGNSFLENARIKIRALQPYFSGSILADDSGLCVDALGGAPGVNSSSYGGVEGNHSRNVTRLLQALLDVPDNRRQAYFYCLLVLVDQDGREAKFEGRCHGRIARTPNGSGGFGYDPIFIPDGCSITMAEMSEEQKNMISHRSRALQALLKASDFKA